MNDALVELDAPELEEGPLLPPFITGVTLCSGNG